VPNTGGSTTPANQGHVQSVARAATLLDAVAESGPGGLGVTEMAGALGVAKSTALALARTLTAHGLLRTTEPGPRYVLGLHLLKLGDLVARQTSMAEVGLPTLRSLSAATGLTARLAINEHGYPIFLERIDGAGAVRFHAPLGQREGPHCTAAGKAILAELPQSEVEALIAEAGMARHTPKTLTDLPALLGELEQVRANGFATDDEEEADGVVCLGSAFFDHQHSCVGAFSVTGLKVDIPIREVQRLGRVVKEHADRMTAMLTGSGKGHSG
jgi:IclR family acetate operon transcriptional repressor